MVLLCLEILSELSSTQHSAWDARSGVHGWQESTLYLIDTMQFFTSPDMERPENFRESPRAQPGWGEPPGTMEHWAVVGACSYLQKQHFSSSGFPEYQGFNFFRCTCKSRMPLCEFHRTLSLQTDSFGFKARRAQNLLCVLSPFIFVSLFYYSKVLLSRDKKKLGSLFLWKCEFIFKSLELFTLTAFFFFFLLTGEYVYDCFSFPK